MLSAVGCYKQLEFCQLIVWLSEHDHIIWKAMIPLHGNATSRVNTMSHLVAISHFVSWKYRFPWET